MDQSHVNIAKEWKFTSKKPILREIQRQLNASWKICSLAVNGLLFLVIEGYLLNFLIPRFYNQETIAKKSYAWMMDRPL